MSEPIKPRIIDMEGKGLDELEERFGIILPLRAMLEDTYPKYNYDFGLFHDCLRIFKRRLLRNKPIIKVYQDGKIELYDNQHRKLADFIAEQLITLGGK